MITLQLDVKTIKMLIPILQKEIEKNPDRFIDIEIKSTIESIPSISWSSDVDC